MHILRTKQSYQEKASLTIMKLFNFAFGVVALLSRDCHHREMMVHGLTIALPPQLRHQMGTSKANSILTRTKLLERQSDGPYIADSALNDQVDDKISYNRREFGNVAAITFLSWQMKPEVAFAASKELSSEYLQGTAALSSNDEADPIPKQAYQKLPSGVVYADIKAGKGPEQVDVGSRVNIQWVLRKSNGYFVDSSAVQGDVPFIFTVGDGSAIQGVDQAIRGMRTGGVRRMLIPLEFGYVDGLDDGKPGPLPAGYGPRQQMRRVQGVRKDVPGEYIFLEVQVTRIR